MLLSGEFAKYADAADFLLPTGNALSGSGLAQLLTKMPGASGFGAGAIPAGLLSGAGMYAGADPGFLEKMEHLSRTAKEDPMTAILGSIGTVGSIALPAALSAAGRALPGVGAVGGAGATALRPIISSLLAPLLTYGASRGGSLAGTATGVLENLIHGKAEFGEQRDKIRTSVHPPGIFW